MNYPDANHKPEIAIALDSLIAVAGFRPVNEIVTNLHSLIELREFAGNDLIDKLLNASTDTEAAGLIDKLYGGIMNKAGEKEKLTQCVKQIKSRLKNKISLTASEEQFLKQYENFGADIGLLSFFFFNIIELKPRQAIFTGAGVPHAYIKGNIVECMANSDNVVRAGLTNKFKDVNTLLEIIKYDYKHYDILNANQNQDEVKYITAAEEFEVSYYNKLAGYKSEIKTRDIPFVYLLTSGSIRVKWESDGQIISEKYSKGESFFIPACLTSFEIYVPEHAEFFTVTIP